MKVSIFIFLFAVSFLTSCSFNKIFLQPSKLSPSTKKIKISTDKDTSIVAFSGETHHPTFYTLQNDTIPLDYTIESVVFKSESGNLLNGWMIKPKNVKPNITLLHFHGNAGFLLSQYQAITPLLKYGFQIFVFDYSGFGFSEGKATRKNVLLDGNSALSYLENRDDVKNTKLLIYGQSLGGHLSAVVASQRQNDIDGLIIEGAFSSYKDIAKVRAGFFGRLLVKEGYSALENIKEYKKPLLIIHSTEDNTVPFELGKKLYENANQPKEFYEIKECHICGPRFYADSISAKIHRMLNQ